MSLCSSTESGQLGVLHLKRYWEKAQLKRNGRLPQQAFREEWKIDNTLLSVLGLGLEQTVRYLYQEAPAFADFEQWIMEVNAGVPDRRQIEEFNTYIISREAGLSSSFSSPANDIFSAADRGHWERFGYVIVRQAVPQQDCDAAIAAICDFIDADLHDPESWCRAHPGRQGIMVQLFQHPALEKNRRAPRIRAAFEALWGRNDLWMNTDRAGFNPPQTNEWQFPGPRLHWDVSLALPIPFGAQGILYLSDTTCEQGAFTLVPGFHNRIEQWLAQLPADAHPREQDLYALGALPLAANAGDFIIWHHALPHGSSVNTSDRPRIVQYINYTPLDAEVNEQWI